MKMNLVVRLSIVFLLLVSNAVSHAASVYKVSKGDKTLYLGGTIHILTTADYPLPEPYETAFKASDKLVFETDIAAMETPDFQVKVGPIMMQPPGATLRQQLTESTWGNLKTFVDKRGIPAQQIQALSPAGATLVLTFTEYKLKGFTQEGVDKFFFDKGSKDEMPITWLESVDSQLALLSSLNQMDPNLLIEYTLKDLSRSDEMINDLHTAWKEGDMDKMTAVGIVEWKRDFPDVYADFLTKRNNAWYPQILDMLKDDTVEYVLVGALHLAGEDGLIYLLEKDGFTVERL